LRRHLLVASSCENALIVPLRIRRADVLHIRVANDTGLNDSRAFGGAVTALGVVRRRPINLDQHGIIDIGPECAFDSL
jgi:hypothetical protein